MRSRALLVGGMTLALAAAPAGPAVAAAQEPELRIELVNGSQREARVAEELRALLAAHDLQPWILTRDVRVEEGVIPHSHPVLTLNTASLGSPDELLATFVHEQLHWLEEPWGARWDAAADEHRRRHPRVPPPSEGGARDDESTYRHLLVCAMEYQALTTLLGETRAREILASQGHYEWIYAQVLNDPEVLEVALRHGLDASRGAPRP